MRAKFTYYDISGNVKNFSPVAKDIRRIFDLLDTQENIRWAYRKYLFSSLDSDFNENRFGSCDKVLKEITSIESGETESYVHDSHGFMHYINRDCVVFEHAIFSVCPHWPLWSCPLLHYKIALQAARDFFAMPESLDTELIVELPDVEMAKVVLFPPLLAERMTND